MNINIRLSIDAPRGWKRRVLLYVATPLALVAGASALVYAYDTSWIADKQPVSASALKGNLDDIQARLTALEKPSVCGSTTTTFTGMISADANVSGYKAARDACVAKCGEPTAHMCTAQEISSQLAMGGGAVGPGWVSSGGTYGATQAVMGDCNGFSKADPNTSGLIFNGLACAASPCSSQYPILCCR